MPAKKTSAAAKKTAKQAPAKKAPVAKSAPVKSSGGAGKIAVGKRVPAFSSLITGGGSWKSSRRQ